MRLRPHHICCMPFWKMSYPERGEGYIRVEEKIKKALRTPSLVLEAARGTDMLCRECPHYAQGRCASPSGNEEQVRKWDEFLLGELGLSYDTRLTAGEWQARVAEKTPFRLCRKCQWRKSCRVGEKLPEP